MATITAGQIEKNMNANSNFTDLRFQRKHELNIPTCDLKTNSSPAFNVLLLFQAQELIAQLLGLNLRIIRHVLILLSKCNHCGSVDLQVNLQAANVLHVDIPLPMTSPHFSAGTENVVSSPKPLPNRTRPPSNMPSTRTPALGHT